MHTRNATWRWKSALVLGLAGALGGAINAWLCYADIPVEISEGYFPWTVVPAGALHGGTLAIVPGLSALATTTWRPVFRVLVAPPVGWVAGYVSWIPLMRSISGDSWGKILSGPFRETTVIGAALAPFLDFGFVSAIYLLCLSFVGLRRSRAVHVIYAVCAGIAGSLWFWAIVERWYVALIHGSVWGSLTGLGMHTATGSTILGKPDVAQLPAEADGSPGSA